MKTKVLLIEDHPMFRERLAQLIAREGDMEVCGETDNVCEGVELTLTTKPQVVILDISLKNSNGLDLLKDLRAHGLDVPVLVLSMHEESLYAERALRAGARGYITKSEGSSKVLVALRQVLRGELYLEAGAMSQIVRSAVDGKKSGAAIERLSDRELEVFHMIGRGRTSRAIGAHLGIGLTTIDTYRARIKEKLSLDNGAQLAREATRWVQTQE